MPDSYKRNAESAGAQVDLFAAGRGDLGVFRPVGHWQLDPDHRGHAHQVFGTIVACNGMKFLLHDSFASVEPALRHDSVAGRVVTWQEGPSFRSAVIARDEADAVSLITQTEQRIGVAVAANELQAARNLMEEVRRAFHPSASSAAIELPFTFWHSSQFGADATSRSIELVDWEEVAMNYAGETRAGLDPLMRMPAPQPNQGRLLLWHGSPGTGKTFAIRALAWAWREWCRFEYVIDPEDLFGSGGYLNEVLLHSDYEDKHRKFRLLIVEDCGEMMGADARQIVGQGLSRLLNVSDGILGQGTRLLILVTTNEEPGKLNPAIVRAGRCFSEIEFHRFGIDEANRWLAARGCEATAAEARTLSELYAVQNRLFVKRDGVRIGFTSNGQNGR